MANNKKNNNYVTDKTTVTKEKERKTKTNKKVKEVVKQVLLITLAVVLIAGAIVGVWFLIQHWSKAPSIEYKHPSELTPTDTVEITLKGYEDKVIEIDLYGEQAPQTVEYLKEIFNKFVDSEFTIGNDFISIDYDGDSQVIDSIDGEFYANKVTTNNIKHVPGVITLNKDGRYYSDASLLYILYENDDHEHEDGEEHDYGLDGMYTAIGYIKNADDLEFLVSLAKEYNGSNSSTTTTPSTDVTFGENEITVDDTLVKTEKKESVEITYTPTEAGNYKFVSDKFTSFEIKLGTVKRVPVSGTSLKDGLEFALEKGKQYTITLGIDGLEKGEYSLVVGDESINVNTKTGKIITKYFVVADETFDRTFAPKTTGVYKFTSSAYKSIAIKLGENAITAVSGTALNSGFEYLLEAGKEYTITLGAGGLETGKQALTISGEILTVGSTNTVNFSTVAKAYAYKLTIETAGVYKFASSESKFTKLVIKCGDEVLTAKSGTTLKDGFEYDLTEGVYTVIIADSSVEEKDYPTAITEGEFTIGEDKKVTFPAIVRSTTYKFTAPSTSKYVFRSADGKITEIVVIDGTTKIDWANIKLEAGKTYDIYMVTKDTTKDSNTVSVVEKTLYADKTNKVTITSTDKSDTIKYTDYLFAPELTGKHEFKITTTSSSSAVAGAEIEILDKDGKSLGKGTAYLANDQVYTIRIKTEKLSVNTTYNVIITEPYLKEGTNTITITKDEAALDKDGVACTGKNEVEYYLKPDNDGKYVITIDKEEFKVEIWNVGENKLVAEEDTTGVASAVLEKGKLYAVKVIGTNDNKLTEDGKLEIKVYSPMLTAESYNQVIFTQDAKEEVFKFEIDVTRLYSIDAYKGFILSSTEEKDRKALEGVTIVLCDEDGKAIEGVDLSYLKLEAGKTYQLKITRTTTVKDEVTISIVKAAPIVQKVEVNPSK